MHIPWQPLSLIGIAVAFYLGFKNNSSYDRLWEARKIWGGIVNASRSFTVMARDHISNSHRELPLSEGELQSITKRLVHRHVAWLRCFALELRKLKPWEHNASNDQYYREVFGSEYKEEKLDVIKSYLSQADFDYIKTKGNRSSHLLSLQSRELAALRAENTLEHFRHLQMQNMITEFYTLQGKAERIKNFPFPRQYSSVNHYFVKIFIILLPFGMLDVFTVGGEHSFMLWLAIPFSALCSWVFWLMDKIGDFSENPFEGLFNDVPISSMAVGIERDIRQMLDETDLPDPVQPSSDMSILL